MKFGVVPVVAAEGAVLAHSIALPDGRMRKGQVLDADLIARLTQAGITSVTVARLAPDDLTENVAAARVARGLERQPGARAWR